MINSYKNKYDVVRLDKITGTTDASKIEVTYSAGTELENGRMVKIDRKTGIINYAEDQDGEIYLHASVETNPESNLLGDFVVRQGAKARLYKNESDDVFSTSAFEDGEYEVGDALKIVAGGRFGKATDVGAGENQYEFVEFDVVGFTKVMVVRVKKTFN